MIMIGSKDLISKFNVASIAVRSFIVSCMALSLFISGAWAASGYSFVGGGREPVIQAFCFDKDLARRFISEYQRLQLSDGLSPDQAGANMLSRSSVVGSEFDRCFINKVEVVPAEPFVVFDESDLGIGAWGSGDSRVLLRAMVLYDDGTIYGDQQEVFVIAGEDLVQKKSSSPDVASAQGALGLYDRATNQGNLGRIENEEAEEDDSLPVMRKRPRLKAIPTNLGEEGGGGMPARRPLSTEGASLSPEDLERIPKEFRRVYEIEVPTERPVARNPGSLTKPIITR